MIERESCWKSLGGSGKIVKSINYKAAKKERDNP